MIQKSCLNERDEEMYGEIVVSTAELILLWMFSKPGRITLQMWILIDLLGLLMEI